jgi:hypothetical protein
MGFVYGQFGSYAAGQALAVVAAAALALTVTAVGKTVAARGPSAAPAH